MNEITFKDLTIFHIYKSNLKNSYISVNPQAKIVLKTPKVSQIYIKNLLIEKEIWIRRQLLKAKENPQIKISLEDEVLLFGDIYSIDIQEASELRKLLEIKKTNSLNNISKCYDEFYKFYASEYLTKRLIFFSKIMELDYREVKFRKMKSRWGSCSSLRVITFNSELIKVKKELIDYVVVHELAHLVHMNHSKNFLCLKDN